VGVLSAFQVTIETVQACPKQMTNMSVVLYKYQIVVALMCGVFGIFFSALGYKYYKLGLFSMGFLMVFFLSISFLDILIVHLYDDEKGIFLFSSIILSKESLGHFYPNYWNFPGSFSRSPLHKTGQNL
jgi:hypothetical protein